MALSLQFNVKRLRYLAGLEDELRLGQITTAQSFYEALAKCRWHLRSFADEESEVIRSFALDLIRLTILIDQAEANRISARGTSIEAITTLHNLIEFYLECLEAFAKTIEAEHHGTGSGETFIAQNREVRETVEALSEFVETYWVRGI